MEEKILDKNLKNNIELNEEEYDYPNESPEHSNTNSIKVKGISNNIISCHNKYLINPSITKFNNLSKFIYDIDEGRKYINSVKNANLIKLNQNEIEIFKEKYISIQEYQNQNNGTKLIELDQKIKNEINDYFNTAIIEDPITLFLKEEYKSNYNKVGFTTRKLAEKYLSKTGNKVSHTTINNILKNNLGLRYLKVVPKNLKILSEESIIYSMALIKIIARCIKNKISIIFCDESSILNVNNNYRAWVPPKSNFYSQKETKKRYNLIMAISENGIVYYELNIANTDEKIFINFIDKLVKKIHEKSIDNFAIFLDNLSVHKSSKLIQFYVENGINIIYNTPYASFFNSIELAFRGLKNILYKNIYESIDKVIKDVHKILNSENFQNTIKYNLKETIQQYLIFFENYKNMNFNKFKN